MPNIHRRVSLHYMPLLNKYPCLGVFVFPICKNMRKIEDNAYMIRILWCSLSEL